VVSDGSAVAVKLAAGLTPGLEDTELAAERFMEAAQGHWVLSSQEEHSCDSFPERVQTLKPHTIQSLKKGFNGPGVYANHALRDA